jgi:hypothetical protein
VTSLLHRSENTKWISPAGRVIRLELRDRRDAMPGWLRERLVAHAAKLDWGTVCVDPWVILDRLAPGIFWRGQWGTAMLGEVEVFVSDPIEWQRHAEVDGAASMLKISYAFSIVERFCWAARAGVWKERNEYRRKEEPTELKK